VPGAPPSNRRLAYAGLLLLGLLLALCLLFPPQGDQPDWRTIWEGWIPAENMAERIKKDKVPYDQWAAKGWIIATEGNVIDYTMIREKILEMKGLYNVLEVDCDKAMATMLQQELQQNDMTCVDIPQTFVSLTDPMNQIEVRLKSQELTHEATPVGRWCFGNTSIAKNGQGYIKFVKEHKGSSVLRTKRIDLVAALVDAMARARYYDSGRSVYDGRGIITL